MFAYLRILPERRIGLSCRWIRLRGIRFSLVEIGSKGPRCLLPLCMKTAARRLRRQGVKQMVFPRKEEPLSCFFMQRGICPVPLLPLYRAMAAKAVLYLLREREISAADATVFLAGESATAALRETARQLCPAVRYLGAELTQDGERMAFMMQREYGVALRQGEEAARQADLTLLFARPAQEVKPAALPLYPGGEAAWPLRLHVPGLESFWEEECQENQMAAALFLEGGVKADEIQFCSACGNA